MKIQEIVRNFSKKFATKLEYRKDADAASI